MVLGEHQQRVFCREQELRQTEKSLSLMMKKLMQLEKLLPNNTRLRGRLAVSSRLP